MWYDTFSVEQATITYTSQTMVVLYLFKYLSHLFTITLDINSLQQSFSIKTNKFSK